MEGARLAGASRIIGVDVNPAKYEQGMNCCQLNSKITIWHKVPDGTLNLPTCPNFQLRNLAALTL